MANFNLLLNSIKSIHLQLQDSATKAINKILTIRNWLIGCYIIEYEQNGEDRAKYGDSLLEKLACELKNDRVQGLTAPELARCRQFYTAYPKIFGTLSQEFIRYNLSNEKIYNKRIRRF